MEWYDPAGVTTGDGSMLLTLSEKATHGLDYQGGPCSNFFLLSKSLISVCLGLVQTWNKFCFTGGYIESSIRLPGIHNVVGLWPALWTMGNLGRAGHGASLEGVVRLSPQPHHVVHALNCVSGHIPTMLATSGLRRIRRIKGFQKLL